MKHAKNKDILVITTGGTIDAAPYDATPDIVTVNAWSAVPAALGAIHTDPESALRYQHLRAVDSKHITPADLRELAEIIANAPESRILITHGTDAMAPNAYRLGQILREIGAGDKMVIVTGSMEPLSHGPDSDGHTNLAHADTVLGGAHQAGVRISMHEQLLDPARCYKDFYVKRFYPLGNITDVMELLHIISGKIQQPDYISRARLTTLVEHLQAQSPELDVKGIITQLNPICREIGHVAGAYHEATQSGDPIVIHAALNAALDWAPDHDRDGLYSALEQQTRALITAIETKPIPEEMQEMANVIKAKLNGTLAAVKTIGSLLGSLEMQMELLHQSRSAASAQQR